MTRAVVVVIGCALCGCWRGEPAPAAPRHPAPRVIPRTTAAREPADRAAVTPNVELAQRLGDVFQLGWLATTVDRVVVLDDAGLRSVCDRAAQAEARDWELMLSDPARGPPQCYEVTPSTDYLCGQGAARRPFALLHFTKSVTGWHLVSVVFGASASTVRAELPRVDAEVEHGVCP